MEAACSGDEALVRALHVCDDGRDWTAWYVWRMGERRRISERAFTLPPERPQIVKQTIKPKKIKRRRKVRPVSEVLGS